MRLVTLAFLMKDLVKLFGIAYSRVNVVNKTRHSSMIPRTVLMAQEVESQFTLSQLEDYGNIILNGYASPVPNTINKKAWQYQETSTAPVNLPSLTEIRPALKGWTTNYMQYYTELPVNAYSQVPGNPTMFDYSVHSFSQATGPITSISGLAGGSGYSVGTHTGVPAVGGSGTGATLNLTVGPGGVVLTAVLATGGTGYTAGDGLTVTTVGPGTGFLVVVGPIGGPISAIQVGATGQAYTPGTYTGLATTTSGLGSGATLDITVGASGTITSVVINAAGTDYAAGDTLVPAGIGPGTGLSISVASVTTAGNAGEPLWAQCPRRVWQNQVSSVTLPQYINNPQVIPYSFIYPVADNPNEPPIDTL